MGVNPVFVNILTQDARGAVAVSKSAEIFDYRAAEGRFR